MLIPAEEESGLKSAQPVQAGNGCDMVYSARRRDGEKGILQVPWLSQSVEMEKCYHVAGYSAVP